MNIKDREEEDLPTEALQPSARAKAIKRLKDATIAAADKRERLPQPLFWSLFTSELAEIKDGKESDRLLDSLLKGEG